MYKQGKKLLTLAICLALLFAFQAATAYADGDVAIDETNFPDATFRAIVADHFDENGDGTLSAAECAAVWHIECES